MSHLRFDPTHEAEPTSRSHFQKLWVWQKSHQDAAAFPLNEPVDREPGSQTSLSVIVPAKDEASSLPRLVSEIILALRPLCTMSGKPTPGRLSRFEIIVVDDGSTDSTSLVLTELAETYPELRSLRLRATVGQSAATVAGFRAARGDWLATLDADLQNDPADLITLWNAPPDHDVALGWRVRRADAWSKRLVSHLANQVRNLVLGQSICDTGCSVRIFPRDLALRLPLFQGVHRFFGPLFLREGCRVIQVPVNHRPRATAVRTMASGTDHSRWSSILLGLPGCCAGLCFIRYSVTTTRPRYLPIQEDEVTKSVRRLLRAFGRSSSCMTGRPVRLCPD